MKIWGGAQYIDVHAYLVITPTCTVLVTWFKCIYQNVRNIYSQKLFDSQKLDKQFSTNRLLKYNLTGVFFSKLIFHLPFMWLS